MESSNLTSYSSTSSKVTINKKFREKSADVEHLKLTTQLVDQSFRRRSNITFLKVEDEGMQEGKLTKQKSVSCFGYSFSSFLQERGTQEC